MQRHHCFFSGRVQGVGFRFTSCRIAARYAVTGYVRNLADGRVELVAEGAAAELRDFVRHIQEALGDNISTSDVSVQEATGEFTEFGIHY
jgi:acylphosphatase